MNRLIKVLMALLCMAAMGRYAYATDNDTEFGIEDDLTVLGTGGTQADPDVEIRGFSLFGSSMGVTMQIPAEPGNVLFGGEVQVSSGVYVTGTSTFTQSLEIQGYGVLKSTVQFLNNTGALTNLYFDNGAAQAGKVLKASANGFLTWEADNNTTMTFATPLRLQMVNAGDTDLVDSLFLQNGEAGTNITMVSGSSMTILGDGTDGLGVNGATKLNDAVTLGDAAGDAITAIGAVTAQNGVSVTGGDVSVTNNLTVNGNAQLGNDRLVDTHGINQAPESGVALAVAGPDAGYAAKFYSGGSLAAWIKKK